MIPYKFNPLGIEKTNSFDFEKGLVFYAPLKGTQDIIGGDIAVNKGWWFTQRKGKIGLQFTNNINSYNQGCGCNVNDFPTNGKPFTISIWYNYTESDFKGSSGDSYNMAIFYSGERTFNRQIGYEISKGYPIPGWAWQPTEYITIYDANLVLIGDGEWHCFSTAFDGTYVFNFFDGILGSQHQTSTLDIQLSNLWIGSRVGDRRYWYGVLNNATIHDYCFTEADAKGFMDYTK